MVPVTQPAPDPAIEGKAANLHRAAPGCLCSQSAARPPVPVFRLIPQQDKSHFHPSSPGVRCPAAWAQRGTAPPSVLETRRRALSEWGQCMDGRHRGTLLHGGVEGQGTRCGAEDTGRLRIAHTAHPSSAEPPGIYTARSEGASSACPGDALGGPPFTRRAALCIVKPDTSTAKLHTAGVAFLPRHDTEKVSLRHSRGSVNKHKPATEL
ncbi:hypothetical protein E2C01_028585 [Portunus trituberculatus]|uniref:Uncharacterized protein n=1 Tax=Portunus trituberculatus TaxID=210409 RepID=A0A5B7EPE2_PORTR|nr:hypothetical protein [Portunus trituberculatus]